MISNAYIHSTDLQEEFLFESHHLLNSISDEMQKLIGLEQEIEEAAMFGESVEDYIPYYEAESKNIFERIGDSLIAMTKSFIKMLSDIVAKIKNSLGLSQKAVKSEAIKNAMKNNPDLADEFLKSVTSGNIKCNDVKDFDELVNEASKISQLYADGKLGDQSFSDKMDAAIKKFSNKAKPIGEIVGVASGVVALGVTLNNIFGFTAKQCESAKEQSLALAKDQEVSMNRARAKMEERINNGEKVYNVNLMAAKTREMYAAMGKSYSAAAKVSNSVWSFLEKHVKLGNTVVGVMNKVPHNGINTPNLPKGRKGELQISDVDANARKAKENNKETRRYNEYMKEKRNKK